MIPKKKLIAVAVATLLLAGVCAVGSALTATHEFVPALLSQLAADGWSPQETQALGLAASGLDWSGVQGADPQVVALSLEMAGRDQQLSAADEAQFALQLATSSAQLAAAGLDDHAQAAAALLAVRTVLSDIQGWIAGGRQGNLGQLIRHTVANAVRHQVQAAAGSQSAGQGPDSQDGQDHGQGQGQGGGVGPITPAGGTFPPPHPGR